MKIISPAHASTGSRSRSIPGPDTPGRGAIDEGHHGEDGHEDDRHVGEAIGFSLSVGLLAPVFSLTALVCALVWISGDTRQSAATRSVSPLQRRNKIAACYAVAGLAVSGLAFALDLDEIGTVACIAATFACHEIMRPVNPSAELHKAFVSEGSALK